VEVALEVGGDPGAAVVLVVPGEDVVAGWGADEGELVAVARVGEEQQRVASRHIPAYCPTPAPTLARAAPEVEDG
jgi:hypothetical protein